MSADLAPEQIRQFVERIMRLKDEQDAIAADVRDVYAEAKALGFDTQTRCRPRRFHFALPAHSCRRLTPRLPNHPASRF